MTLPFDPRHVLDFWFPDDGHWLQMDTHVAFWQARMRGGMDAAICDHFGPVTEAAADGHLDHWAETPRGRLALVIALDQFSRSYWRHTPAAYAQDMKACRLVTEAVASGHYAALRVPWEREFMIIALTHCEGPDHLARMDLALELAGRQGEVLHQGLEALQALSIEQNTHVREIIARFGRHPHRNAILGRPSTAAEAAYIAEGKFPHERKIEAPV
ncbi:MAG: DUF924 family protein [Pseudomonadota bacterium]